MTVENRSRLTSGYGYQAWRGYSHTGIDFGGVIPGRSSPVLAAAAGVVEFVGWDLIPLRRGQHIGIRHPDGSLTFYGHIRYPKVAEGQHVRRGDRLADTWYTGLAASAGVHLHFEWWRDADDHTTHFDPTARLADYGWIIRDGRLHDEWDGRATATDTTITPASTDPTIPEGDLTMAQIDDIDARLARIEQALDISKNSTSGAVVNDHGNGDKTTVAGAVGRLLTLVRDVRDNTSKEN